MANPNVVATLVEQLQAVAKRAADENDHDTIIDILRALSERPGVRTTEFWLSVVLNIVGGAFQFWPGHEQIGALLMTVATGAYVLSRGFTKAAAAKVTRVGAVLLAFALLGAGCSSNGMIRADGIEGLVTDVTARCDRYIDADPELAKPENEAKKNSAKRSNQLLRQVVAEAKKSAADKATTTDAQTAPAGGK